MNQLSMKLMGLCQLLAAKAAQRSLITVAVLLFAVFLVACDRLPAVLDSSQAASPTEQLLPTVESEEGAVVLSPVEIVESSTANTEDRGNLVVVFSDTGNDAPVTQGRIVVIRGEDNRVIKSGTTAAGIYRTMLPPGSYDVLLVQDSLPVGGMLREDILIEKDQTTAVTSYVAAEGQLIVRLLQKDGRAPKGIFVVEIWSNGELIWRKASAAGAAELPVTLRTDHQYDVLVEYGDVTLGEEDVIVESTGSELELTLPQEEAALRIIFTAGGEALEEGANVELLDAEEKIFAAKNGIMDVYEIILPVGVEYLLRMQYQDQVLEERISVVSTPLVPKLYIDFDSP